MRLLSAAGLFRLRNTFFLLCFFFNRKKKVNTLNNECTLLFLTDLTKEMVIVTGIGAVQIRAFYCLIKKDTTDVKL